MLFNSLPFIFGYLPLVLLGFYMIGHRSHAMAVGWLAVASIFFYGWWDLRYVGLLLASIVFNYSAGYLMCATETESAPAKSRNKRLIMAAALVANLGLLIYYKYANFFVSNLDQLTGVSWTLGEVILPLGISFFTFTQIAFLVDTYRGKVKEFNFINYTLFVTYFPHLIAGPVLHHSDMMPQFSLKSVCKFDWTNIAVGLSIFVLGLAKKVLLADWVAEYSTPVFAAVNAGGSPHLIESWMGALAYSLQLYFDFSAYSDMAIGLSLMFNVRLPLNFNSPYKSRSIIEFWRRWHMTLSRFLRDYLYIPLGGSRLGPRRRYANLFITMLLGGLWHGAGWTFIIWGGLHGFYLLVNHAWRDLKSRLGWTHDGPVAGFFAGALTSIAVVVGWVFFRADSTRSAIALLEGMLGLNGISLPGSLEPRFGALFQQSEWVKFEGAIPLTGLSTLSAVAAIALGLVIVWFAPNVCELFRAHQPTCDDVQREVSSPVRGNSRHSNQNRNPRLEWAPTRLIAWILGILFIICLSSMMTSVSQFLYFQF
jgi:D-alanyl-lipoteichoic acid acyltransferase DltB (MBOAT superfamily)